MKDSELVKMRQHIEMISREMHAHRSALEHVLRSQMQFSEVLHKRFLVVEEKLGIEFGKVEQPKTEAPKEEAKNV